MPKNMRMAKVKAFERASKNASRQARANAKMTKAQAKAVNAKSKRSSERIASATLLGTQMIQASTKKEQEQTKRAALSVEKLKSWNDLIDGNPDQTAGSNGQTQNKSTTDIGSTDRRIKESVNYG